MCGSYVAWSICGTQSSGIRPVSNTWVGFWKPIPRTGLPLPALIQREELSPYLNLICHALLTPMEDLPVSEQKQEERIQGGQKGGGRREWERRRERKLQYGCKINEKIN